MSQHLCSHCGTPLTPDTRKLVRRTICDVPSYIEPVDGEVPEGDTYRLWYCEVCGHPEVFAEP